MTDAPAVKKIVIPGLTDEHRASFGEWVDKWTAIGRCTDPADRARAEGGVAEAYRAAGMEEHAE